MKVAKIYELNQPEIELAIRTWLIEKHSISLDDSNDVKFSMDSSAGSINAVVTIPLE